MDYIIADALVTSAVGICVVMFILAIIAVIIILLSKIIRAIEAKASKASHGKNITNAPEAASAATPLTDNAAKGEVELIGTDEKTAAVIMAIVSRQSETPLNRLSFKSIRLIDGKKKGDGTE